MKYFKTYEEYVLNEGLLSDTIKGFFTSDPKEFKYIYRFLKLKDKEKIINLFEKYTTKVVLYKEFEKIISSVIFKLNLSPRKFFLKRMFLNKKKVLYNLDKLYKNLDYDKFKKDLYDDLGININNNTIEGIKDKNIKLPTNIEIYDKNKDFFKLNPEDVIKLKNLKQKGMNKLKDLSNDEYKNLFN